MGKSVYSLVLSDDIVAAVDRAAYRAGSSRSNFINQVLAEYVSYTTPEAQMQNIFNTMDELFHSIETFKVQPHASGSMMSVYSALRYKYNPTVRYSVELYEQTGPEIGELKVLFRTQNEGLVAYLNEFFTFWASLEKHYLGNYFPGGIMSDISGARFTRRLKIGDLTQTLTPQVLGEAIAQYIETLDKAMKEYFSYLDRPAAAQRKTEECYRQYLQSNAVKI